MSNMLTTIIDTFIWDSFNRYQLSDDTHLIYTYERDGKYYVSLGLENREERTVPEELNYTFDSVPSVAMTQHEVFIAGGEYLYRLRIDRETGEIDEGVFDNRSPKGKIKVVRKNRSEMRGTSGTGLNYGSLLQYCFTYKYKNNLESMPSAVTSYFNQNFIWEDENYLSSVSISIEHSMDIDNVRYDDIDEVTVYRRHAKYSETFGDTHNGFGQFNMIGSFRISDESVIDSSQGLGKTLNLVSTKIGGDKVVFCDNRLFVANGRKCLDLQVEGEILGVIEIDNLMQSSYCNKLIRIDLSKYEELGGKLRGNDWVILDDDGTTLLGASREGTRNDGMLNVFIPYIRCNSRYKLFIINTTKVRKPAIRHDTGEPVSSFNVSMKTGDQYLKIHNREHLDMITKGEGLQISTIEPARLGLTDTISRVSYRMTAMNVNTEVETANNRFVLKMVKVRTFNRATITYSFMASNTATDSAVQAFVFRINERDDNLRCVLCTVCSQGILNIIYGEMTINSNNAFFRIREIGERARLQIGVNSKVNLGVCYSVRDNESLDITISASTQSTPAFTTIVDDSFTNIRQVNIFEVAIPNHFRYGFVINGQLALPTFEFDLNPVFNLEIINNIVKDRIGLENSFNVYGFDSVDKHIGFDHALGDNRRIEIKPFESDVINSDGKLYFSDHMYRFSPLDFIDVRHKILNIISNSTIKANNSYESILVFKENSISRVIINEFFGVPHNSTLVDELNNLMVTHDNMIVEIESSVYFVSAGGIIRINDRGFENISELVFDLPEYDKNSYIYYMQHNRQIWFYSYKQAYVFDLRYGVWYDFRFEHDYSKPVMVMDVPETHSPTQMDYHAKELAMTGRHPRVIFSNRSRGTVAWLQPQKGEKCKEKSYLKTRQQSNIFNIKKLFSNSEFDSITVKNAHRNSIHAHTMQFNESGVYVLPIGVRGHFELEFDNAEVVDMVEMFVR